MNKFAIHHRPPQLFEFRGQKMTNAEIAALTGISVSGVCRRRKAGKPLEAPRRQLKPRTKPEVSKPMPRSEVIVGLVNRSRDPEAHETLETLLQAAYDAGAAVGQSTRGDFDER